MTLIKTDNTIEGKSSEVLETISKQYPDVAEMTLEILCAMLLTDTSELVFTSDHYDKVNDVNIRLSIEDDKVKLEILDRGNLSEERCH